MLIVPTSSDQATRRPSREKWGIDDPAADVDREIRQLKDLAAVRAGGPEVVVGAAAGNRPLRRSRMDLFLRREDQIPPRRVPVGGPDVLVRQTGGPRLEERPVPRTVRFIVRIR
jgi:hypothetical protein